MGNFSSIYVGISGLNANSQWLNDIGNNIANMSTVAFKANRPTFADLVRGSLAGGGQGADGMGVAMRGTQLNFAQGALSQSSNPMDWAIDGQGFFVVNDADGNSFYTRAGQFKLQVGKDSHKITDVEGHVLQGYVPDEQGVIGDVLGDVKLDVRMTPKATSKATTVLNLESSAAVPSAAFDATDAKTYNFSVSERIFDSRKDVTDVAHTLSTYFAKTKDNTWDVHVRVDSGKASRWGQLTFGTNGTLTSSGKYTVALDVPLGGTPPSSLSQSLELDLTGTTQYGSDSAILSQSQNGYNGGELQDLSLAEGGIITGSFSNQQHQTVGQVALAGFEAPWGLTQLGNGLFAASDDSGAAATTKPSSVWVTGRPSVGQVKAGMLELSNVELTDNFVDMIAAQFGFQAGSKAITSTDEMLQVALQLIR